MVERMSASKQVAAAVDAFLRAHPHGRLWVGFSGGRDSATLLHALAQHPQAKSRQLRAVHIDHQLHPQSARWAKHARGQAEAWSVPIEVRQVDLRGRSEVGEEARARAARREVYAELLQAGDWMLLAHHREDQAETVLLRLFSGSGLVGMGAMRVVSAIGQGQIGRPLLGVSGDCVQAYADEHGIVALTDPANADPRHERSWLRTEILPRIAGRHPQISSRLARSAEWFAATADWLQQQAASERARRQGIDPAALNIADWQTLAEPLRHQIVSLWLRDLGLAEPGAVAFAHLESDLIAARSDANPGLRWGSGSLRRYRQSLVWVTDRDPLPDDWAADWTLAEPLSLPARLGLLRAEQVGEGDSKLRLKASLRRGGERFRPRPDRPSRPLQHCLQELGVPPWERQRLLLLSNEQELVAVLAIDSGAVVLRNDGITGWVFSLGPMP